MSQVSCKFTINAPADAIWMMVGDFGAACQYLVRVVQCTVAGEGVGAQRTLTYTDGAKIVERLEARHESGRRLSYTLLTDTPFGDCRTTLAVRDLGRNQAELAWSATFQPDGLPADEAVALLESALTANGLALKRLFDR